ncbi:MAG TPA: class I SAM-dependent methyltransferase, partial [Kofleriaceae bacterium]
MTCPRADLIRAGYAPIAAAYRAELGGELLGKPLDRAFLAAFVERCRGTIADVGCGPGHVARFLADLGAEVEGVDLSPAMIAEARAQFPELTFRVGDLFALPYARGALGGAVVFYAIVHLRGDELAAPFAELHRVVAPGGLVALAFHQGREVVQVDEMFGVATRLDFVFHAP